MCGLNPPSREPLWGTKGRLEQLVSKVVEGLLSRRGPGIFWAEEELGPLLSLILGRE